MAVALIDQLTGPFEPDLVTDDYRAALEAVIEVKMSGGQPAARGTGRRPGQGWRPHGGPQRPASKPPKPSAPTGSKPKAEAEPKAKAEAV